MNRYIVTTSIFSGFRRCAICGLALFSGLALANDGFYQGAGATLMPVHNDKLRVMTENLEITPPKTLKCYQIQFRGKPVKGLKDAPAHAQGTLGPETKCPAGLLGNSVFKTQFHAKAVYHVKALEDVTDVQMGFPVANWSYEFQGTDGLNGIEVPGVVGFVTTINGEKVRDIEAKTVQSLPSLWDSKKTGDLPAMVWHSSFKKGADYEIVSEYDFGFDVSTGFYEPNVPKGYALWWDTRSVPEGAGNLGGVGLAETAIYFLHPIQLWAPPAPEKISVRVEAPKGVPVTYLVTATRGLDCIDTHALYFKWENAYPENDLRVSFPSIDFGYAYKPLQYRSIKKPAEFEAWIKLLGAATQDGAKGTYFGKLKLSCALVEQIKKTAEKDVLIFPWIQHGVLKCVEKCG